MANVKMGFEGMIYYGATGSTAATLLENVQDISYNLDHNTGNTTVRGDSTVPPMVTEQVSSRVVSIDFTMINDITDTEFAAIQTAAYAGTPVALRLKDYSAGKGFDGDVFIKVTNNMPLDGEQAVQFNAIPTRESGRTPVPYV